MTRRKRKSKSSGAKSRRTRPSRSRQARQDGWRRWLPTAALVLAVILIGVGGVWFVNGQGNAGSGGTAASMDSLADVPRITPRELKAKLDAGQAVVFDARRQVDYANKHIAGATSLPQDEVQARLAELPTDKLAVFYCT